MPCIMPKDYLLPEIREGELLDEKKKKLFKTSISILEEIKRICEQHNLRYFAAYGTLLGAVRHKGFIPWDDDIDLWMPRSDMIRFQQVAQSDLPPYLFLQTTASDPEMTMDFFKVRDNRTTSTVKWELDAGMHINMGIWVTIFPLDGRPKNDFAAETIFVRKYNIGNLIARALRRKNICLAAYFIHLASKVIMKMIGLKKLCAKRNDLCLPFDGSDRCTSMWSMWAYNRLNCPTNAFSECIELPFEYTTLRAPKDYEIILKELYGDWRVPVKESSQHQSVDLEPDIPWRDFVKKKYGWKI